MSLGTPWLSSIQINPRSVISPNILAVLWTDPSISYLSLYPLGPIPLHLSQIHTGKPGGPGGPSGPEGPVMPWKGVENAGYQLLDEGGIEGGDPCDPAIIRDSLLVPFPGIMKPGWQLWSPTLGGAYSIVRATTSPQWTELTKTSGTGSSPRARLPTQAGRSCA